MIKKFIIAVFLAISLLLIGKASAQEAALDTNEKVNVYFFYGEGCPHCAKEKPFLKELEEDYPEIEVKYYEVWGNKENLDLMTDFAEKLDADVRGVPFTVIGEQYFIGWMDEGYTGRQIEDAVKSALGGTDSGLEDTQRDLGEKTDTPEGIDLPVFGKIETKNLSLPVITIIMGSLDGFNPCAMWTLIFLISVLLGLKDRKRMWLLGTIFIATSALVYFLFMAAWLNFILFLGMIALVRLVIGLVALLGGAYNIKDYFTNKTGACKVTNTKKRQNFFQKLKAITYKKSLFLAIGGIILLAFAVNLVEAVCSAGLPAVYAQILSLNDLSTLEYYFYILLYIFFFMLDDLIVFFIAMTTLHMTGFTNKYSHWSSLIGGVIMLIIGFILILKPELLMFG